ncbi:MAG: GNAT family protein [bacterium]
MRIPVDDQTFLQPLEQSDAEDLFTLIDANRLYLRQWLPWLDTVLTMEDMISFINYMMQQAVSKNGLQTGIRRQGMLVGIIGLYRIDWANRSANIGYWLAEELQGKGIMTESTRALVDYAFQSMHLHRLEIRCAMENERSRAIPKRLGFEYEGYSRSAEWLYDHYIDHAVYCKLATEWHKPGG